MSLGHVTPADAAHVRHAATKTSCRQEARRRVPPEAQIIGTINGQVLTERDVENRGRLFALSTGLSISPELMQRLRPQIIRQTC